jgi:hypothetical protein
MGMLLFLTMAALVERRSGLKVTELGFVWVGWMYGFHGFSQDFYGF